MSKIYGKKCLWGKILLIFTAVFLTNFVHGADTPVTCDISDLLTVKLENLRSDSKENIYIQPNMTFLYSGKSVNGSTVTFSSPLNAGKTININTLTPDPNSKTTYTFYTWQNPVNSGLRLYFSIGEKIPDSPVNGAGVANSHSCTESDMENIRFDWVEATFDGTPGACANLSSLEQLGICFALESQKGGSKIGSYGWKYSLSDIITSQLENSSALQGKLSDGSFVRIKGAWSYPSIWPAPGIVSSADGQAATIYGSFNGVKDGDITPAVFKMSGTFTNGGKDITLSGNFYNITMKPDGQGGQIAVRGSAIPGTMSVSNIDIQTIYEATASPQCKISCTGGGYSGDPDASKNDRWSCLLNFLMTGFNDGFWGSSNTSNSLDWSLSNAFTGSSYNVYSAMISKCSNSYGDPYSDHLHKTLLSVTKGNVDTLVIRILDDNSISQPSAGYTQPGTVYQAGYDVSFPSALNLKSLTFTDSENKSVGSVDIPAGATTAGFPVGLKRNVKYTMAMEYRGYNNGGQVKGKYPSISITLPEDPFPKPAAIKISPSWQNITDKDIFWSQSQAAPFLTLQLSAEVNPKNFTPGAQPTLKKYLINGVADSALTLNGIGGNYKSVSLTGITYSVGGKNITMPKNSSNQIEFPAAIALDTPTKIIFNYLVNGTQKVQCSITLSIPSLTDSTAATINMTGSGWNTTIGGGSADAYFIWNKNSSGIIWNLNLSPNTSPANFIPPTKGSEDI